MQVILDSSFARPGSAPIWGGKKGEFRDWTTLLPVIFFFRPDALKVLQKLPLWIFKKDHKKDETSK